MNREAAQRKLILYMSQSLDGFAARRDGTMDWLGGSLRYDQQRQRAVEELLGRAGLLVLGARAGQDMARAWPTSQSPTGEYMNTLPKIVYSSTLAELEWSNARGRSVRCRGAAPAHPRAGGRRCPRRSFAAGTSSRASPAATPQR